jgi:hypothetical protein
LEAPAAGAIDSSEVVIEDDHKNQRIEQMYVNENGEMLAEEVQDL